MACAGCGGITQKVGVRCVYCHPFESKRAPSWPDRRKSIAAAVKRADARGAAGKLKEPRLPRRVKVSASGAPTEFQEQAALCDWLKLHGIVYFAIPNGAHFHGNQAARMRQGSRLKRVGMKSGVPDLFIVTSPPAHLGESGVFVEMKRVKGGRLSDNQKEWKDKLEVNGFLVRVCYGADDAIEKLEGLGYGRAA